MSTGLRDQRVRIYGYSVQSVDGMPGSRYTFLRERWARKTPAGAREALVASQAQHTVDWVFTFDQNVDVPTDGVLRHKGEYYKVTGVYPSRITGELAVHAVHAGDEVYDDVVEG